MRALGWVWVLVVMLAVVPAAGEEKAGVRFFGFEDDRDFDGQPDFWRRVTSPEYPSYLKANLTDRVSYEGKRSLVFLQNGGSLLYRSPQLEVSPLQDYELVAWIRTEELDRSEARVRVIWLDAAKREVGRVSTGAVSGTSDWTEVRLFEESVPAGTMFAVIECVMEGRDIRGSAWFDAIKFAEHPKLSLGLGVEGNLVGPGVPRVVIGKITGLPGRSTEVKLALRDHAGRSAWGRTEQLGAVTDSYEFAWRLPSGLYGHYSAECSVKPSGAEPLEVRRAMVFPPPLPTGLGKREPALAVDVPDAAGWAEDKADSAIVARATSAGLGMLEMLGVGLRMEIDMSDEDEAGAVQSLLRRVVGEGYYTVAVIPMGMIVEGGEDAVKWALIEYGDLVKAWQVGVEGEEVEMTPTVGKALELLRELARPALVGMPVGLAEGFGSFSPDFVVVRAASEAAGEIAADAVRAARGWKRVWVELPPGLSDDMKDLVEATLGCLREGAERVVLLPSENRPALFDKGLFPKASYLVWRNLNSLFSGVRYAGTLRLPEGSGNMVFRDEREFRLVCWSDGKPELEGVNLGGDVRFWDVFGRRLNFPIVGGKSQIRTGALPVFATGLNRTIMEMTLSARLLSQALYMEAGLQREGLSVANRLGENLECKLDLRYPPGFTPERRRYVFDLGPEEEFVAEAPVSVPRDIVPGKQMLYATLEVSGRESLFLELFKEFQVVSEIEMRADARRDGEFVEVSQEVVNRAGSTLELVGLAGVPGELPQQSLSATVEPGGMIVRSYRFPAEEVVGKRVWVAVREANGTRFVNQYVDVDDESD